jgi:hypothetical protein
MTVIAEEERVDGTPASFEALLERLSRSSVTPGKHFDAYTDIDWDAPENAIDPSDARWELGNWDPLGATAWYKSQPQSVRAGIALHFVADQMRSGLQFESVLKRGLLEFASMEPNRSPVFRYAYHEVIEEAQHSLMFQEFVNRSGVDPVGVPRAMRPATREVIKFGRRFPPLFFVFVLGGEDPIDYVQRRSIRRHGDDVHPLLMRIMRIHVTEEARHLSFARHYLKLTVPELGPLRRRILALTGPVILGVMAGLMMRPSRQLVRRYRIPRSVLREAYSRSPEARAEVRTSLRKVRALLDDLGLITPTSRLIWRFFGIWDAPGAEAAPANS